MSGTRPVRRPAPDFGRLAVPVCVRPPGPAWRVHAQGQSPLYFSLNPGHRFSYHMAPFFVLYLGEDIDTCLWERFGDDVLNPGAPVPRSLWLSRAVSRIELPELRLCDLTAEATRVRVRVDLAALKHPDLAVPQAWGVAIQEHPAGFEGIRYGSRFHGGACLALFDRDGLGRRLRVAETADLAELPAGDAFLKRHGVGLV